MRTIILVIIDIETPGMYTRQNVKLKNIFLLTSNFSSFALTNVKKANAKRIEIRFMIILLYQSFQKIRSQKCVQFFK